MFSPDIQFAVTADESNDRDDSIWDIGYLRDGEFRRGKKGFKSSLLKELKRGRIVETSVTMVPIVEKLKVFGLSPEGTVVTKPLSTKESSVIGIIETFHHGISPRFSDRDEYSGRRNHPVRKVDANQSGQGFQWFRNGVPVATD